MQFQVKIYWVFFALNFEIRYVFLMFILVINIPYY